MRFRAEKSMFCQRKRGGKMRNVIKELKDFLKTETPTGFADGLMFHKYRDLLARLKKGENDPATLKHFLDRVT